MSYCGLNSVKQCCKCHQQQVPSLQWRLAAPTLCLLLWWYILTDLSMSISLSYDVNDAGLIITASLIKCWLVYANMGLAPCTIYAPCQGKGASSLPTALVDPWHALVWSNENMYPSLCIAVSGLWCFCFFILERYFLLWRRTCFFLNLRDQSPNCSTHTPDLFLLTC